MRDDHTGISKEFGFVSYTRQDEAANALTAMDGTRLVGGNGVGKNVVVRLHEPKRFREGRMRDQRVVSNGSEVEYPTRGFAALSTGGEVSSSSLSGVSWTDSIYSCRPPSSLPNPLPPTSFGTCPTRPKPRNISPPNLPSSALQPLSPPLRPLPALRPTLPHRSTTVSSPPCARSSRPRRRRLSLSSPACVPSFFSP